MPNINLSSPITLDLTEVKTDPVDEGWHHVKIERADAKKTSNKGLTSIFVMSRIQDEADPDFNRTLIWNCNLEGGGLIFTKRFFEAAGMPMQLEYESVQALADDLIGREVDAKVSHEAPNEYHDEVKAQVNKWREHEIGLEF
jgi:hypothetical protein